MGEAEQGNMGAVPAVIEEGAATKPKSWSRRAAWLFENFGALIVFVAFEHLVGLLAAIISGIVTGVLLVAWQIVRDRKVSPFTAFIAASVVGFGALDLHYRTGFFVKIEPALGNAFTGIFFLGSVFVGRPIILEFAEKQLARKIPESAYPYLRGWTVVWALFFFARASVYVWMAYALTIDQAIAVRSIAGPASFAGMFGIEIVTRKIWFPKKATSLPV